MLLKFVEGSDRLRADNTIYRPRIDPEAKQHELDFADQRWGRLDIFNPTHRVSSVRTGRPPRYPYRSDRQAAKGPHQEITPLHSAFLTQSHKSICSVRIKKRPPIPFIGNVRRQY